MKFLTKINRQYILTLSILLIIISIIGYFMLKSIIFNEIKEDIFEKEYAIINEIKANKNPPNIYPIIETKHISKSEIEKKSYEKINLHDEAENEDEPYIEYTNTVKIEGQYYLIKLRHSLLETDDLIMAIALPLLLLLVLSLLVLFISTKKLNRTIWKDFETNLKIIEEFSFDNFKTINLKPTNIEEFNRLNATVIELTRKLQNDYKSLKEFTENASHELQTPISIIALNLDEILQQDLSEPVFKQVVATQNAIKRLSILNKNLLLLTKINNHQYTDKQELVINNLIENKIEEFKPLLQSKNIKVSTKNNENLIIIINPYLVDILLNNLLSNAIKHNIEDGEIVINISKNQMQICNIGIKNSLTNKNIFNRFIKENSQSYGLGLSIVKQICETHNIEISYTKNKLHCFKLTS